MADPGVDVVLARVKLILAELLNIQAGDIGDNDQLLEADGETPSLNLDSLDALKLALALAEEYSLRDPVDVDWSTVSTVRDVAGFVFRLLNPQSASLP